MPEIEEGAWLGADESHIEWTTRVRGGEDGTVLSRWTHSSRESAEAKAEEDTASNRGMMLAGVMVDDGSEIDAVWRAVGPWCTGDPATAGDQVPTGAATADTLVDLEPFDTHREIVCTRSTGNKDIWKCVDCGGKLVQIGVRLPNGHLANPDGSGTLTTKVCTVWRAGDA